MADASEHMKELKDEWSKQMLFVQNVMNVHVLALLQKILGVEWNSKRSVFLARKLLFLTARSRALPLSGDCSKPVAIKRRNIFL